MVTVQLQGGIGNQLFQWAFGKVLSKNYSVNYVDSYNSPNQYSYCLDKFRMTVPLTTEVQGPTRSSCGNTKFDEKEFIITQEPCVLSGYWQSEKYFLCEEETIRKEIVIREVNDSVQKIIDGIKENSIFVHVRRGDYTGPSRNIEMTLPLDYYHRAIEYIKDRIENPKFYIFSDEPWWVRENLNIPNSEAVHLSTYNDLWVMSKCRHAIIANSTYSWWGAWLGDKQGNRLVIAPAQWLITNDTSDLVPARWTQI